MNVCTVKVLQSKPLWHVTCIYIWYVFDLHWLCKDFYLWIFINSSCNGRGDLTFLDSIRLFINIYPWIFMKSRCYSRNHVEFLRNPIYPHECQLYVLKCFHFWYKIQHWYRNVGDCWSLEVIVFVILFQNFEYKKHNEYKHRITAVSTFNS